MKDDIELIRTKIYNHLEKMKEESSRFSKRFESQEIEFFKKQLGVYLGENLNKDLLTFIKIYENLISLRNDINEFKDLFKRD